MKRILVIFVLSIMAQTLFAQKDVTTFLGIPIDGYKSEMRQKLINKGFIPKKSDNTEYFEGEFNGQDVHIYIGTNNNKVYRLYIADVNTLDEANIRIRFNNLVNQFANNKRYFTITDVDDFIIPEDEDISYEMNVKNKIYEATFYQVPQEPIDTMSISMEITEQILNQYTEEELQNLSEEEFGVQFINKMKDIMLNKQVWFRISEHYGKYYISMYYDNEYNKANGEDL